MADQTEMFATLTEVSQAWNGRARMTTKIAIDKLRPLTLQSSFPLLAMRASTLLNQIVIGIEQPQPLLQPQQ